MTLCQATTETTDRPEPCYGSCVDIAQAGDANSGQDTRSASCFWSQMDAAQAVADFSDPFHPPCSQRDYAEQHGIPRSTLGAWLRKEYPEHLDKDLVAFFRRPAGIAFLRRVVPALLLVFHHHNPCGLHAISHFLKLAELDYFVGASYGALYTLDQHLQDDLILFAKEERQRLGASMAAKDIVLCGDENFHSALMCLIAMEPVSNFILVEIYASQRDSQTWANAVAAGIKGLPVHVVVFTTDQASGLIRCAEKELEVLHQPELFHLQHNLGKPVLLPLARPVHQAEKEFQKARQETQRLDKANEEQPGSIALATMLEVVREELQAKRRLDEAQEKLDRAVAEIRAVGEVYHPFDRETGRPVTAEQMQTRLSEPLQRLQQVVEEAGLGERAHKAVQKSHEWVVVLVGYLAWFTTMAQTRREELHLSEEGQRLFEQYLMPSYYWKAASQREKDPDERKRLAELAEELRERAWAKGGALEALNEEEKQQVQQVAQQCVHLFCRSSSCVEGRNGRLSLFHHGQTRLSEKRLQTLTAVHNYVVRREDGTTAAERFFGQKQRDAFDWLLQRMPELPRPAAKRPKKASKVGSLAA
jgi:hypothetical protein